MGAPPLSYSRFPAAIRYASARTCSSIPAVTGAAECLTCLGLIQGVFTRHGTSHYSPNTAPGDLLSKDILPEVHLRSLHRYKV